MPRHLSDSQISTHRKSVLALLRQGVHKYDQWDAGEISMPQ